MSSRWQLDGFSPLWVFDGCDWCEAAWLHPSAADAFESFLCQPTDSLVTWVSWQWVIGRVIAWLQPRGTASQLIKYLHSACRDRPLLLLVTNGVWSPVLSASPWAFMHCCPGGQNIAHIPIKAVHGAKIQSRNSQHGWSCSSDRHCPTESALGWGRGFRDVTNIINRALAYSLSISQSWAPLAAPRQTPSNTHGCYWSSRDWCFRGPRRWPRLWKI